MKTHHLAAMVAATILTASLAASAANPPSIIGGSHDFRQWPSTGADYYGDPGQICKPCHTPHNAIATDVSSAVWSHTLSTFPYRLHGTDTYDANGNKVPGTYITSSAGGVTELDRQTRLCLSCHDGTVALDSFVGAISPTTGKMVGKKNLTADLSNDHPLGIQAATDPATNSFAATDFHAIADIKLAVPLMHLTSGGQTLQVVGCMTCHDPHLSQTSMLRIDNKDSKLCLTCHIM